MILKPYQGKTPKIHPTAWIAENAVIIGDVEIGAHSSVWYNCVIRGDTNYIRIGDETNIQDGTIVHVETDGGPCLIGNRITIGHAAVVHGCTVKDGALIGIGAKILSYAEIGEEALIAAGALVREKTIVPARIIMAGVPAQEKGTISDSFLERMREGTKHYVDLAREYRNEKKH